MSQYRAAGEIAAAWIAVIWVMVTVMFGSHADAIKLPTRSWREIAVALIILGFHTHGGPTAGGGCRQGIRPIPSGAQSSLAL